MRRPIQFCLTCDGVVSTWSGVGSHGTISNEHRNERIIPGWSAEYVEGALWCDCPELAPVIENGRI